MRRLILTFQVLLVAMTYLDYFHLVSGVPLQRLNQACQETRVAILLVSLFPITTSSISVQVSPDYRCTVVVPPYI